MSLFEEEMYDLDGIEVAYSTYQIFSEGGAPPYGTDKVGRGDVLVVCTTNDNGDTGYPGSWAMWDLWFETVEEAMKHTGKTRQGVGHRVFVELDGIRV